MFRQTDTNKEMWHDGNGRKRENIKTLDFLLVSGFSHLAFTFSK